MMAKVSCFSLPLIPLHIFSIQHLLKLRSIEKLTTQICTGHQ